ncbi:MAG: PilZ domain-containing protein [Candidatus Thiodiazotropha endolucinida]
MEHRRDHRKLLSFEIVINDRTYGQLHGKVRNISLSGMLVDIGDSSHHLNPIVDVSFPVESCGGKSQCQAKAFIVHQQSGCLGLMFSELDAGVRQMLRKMLYGYATVAERAYMHTGYSDTSQALPNRASANY